MVTIISVRLKSKSLLRKEINGDFEKKPEIPHKWSQIKINSVPLESAWSDTMYREIRVPLLELQRKSLFASATLVCLPFFSVGQVGYQNIIDRCSMAHSKAISHI